MKISVSVFNECVGLLWTDNYNVRCQYSMHSAQHLFVITVRETW